MEAIMDAQGWWEAINPGTVEEVDGKKTKAAKAFIFQAIPEDILLQVAKKKTAKEVWEALKTRYLGADRVQKARLQTLKGNFESLKMKDGETIEEFAGKLSGMAAKYIDLGATLDDATLVRKLLDSVPNRFLQLVASIEQYSDIETMLFEDAIGRLMAYEERIKSCNSNNNEEEGLLLTQFEWQQRFNRSSEVGGRSRGRGRGRTGWNSFKSDGGALGKRDKSHIRCFNCQKFGHYASECRLPSERNNEVHLTHTHEDEPTLLMVETKGTILLNEEKVMPELRETKAKENEGIWYLDNGASNHMTGRKNYFAELDENFMGRVRFGDNSTVDIRGKGSILLQCKNGDQKLITDVYYIPKLCSNILSLGQVTEKGCRVVMSGDLLWLYVNDHKLLMKVPRGPNRLYQTKLHTLDRACLGIQLEDTAWIWHARLGHVNFSSYERDGGKGSSSWCTQAQSSNANL